MKIKVVFVLLALVAFVALLQSADAFSARKVCMKKCRKTRLLEEECSRRCGGFSNGRGDDDDDTLEFDEVEDDDEDDEDECSVRNFERVLKATAKITGPAPNQFCARAVFDKICDRCEDNLECYIKLGRVVGPKTPECRVARDGDDEDDEDECSARNFERVMKATAKITGGAPNQACARAVFDKICDRCEGDLQCYIKLGRVVGPKTPECRVARDEDDEDDEDECSARNFERVLKAAAKITGGAPNKACARAVFNKICDRCEDNLQCYIKLGRVVGPKTRACRKPAMDEIVGARSVNPNQAYPRSLGSSKAPTKLETEKKEVGKQAENKEEKKEENSSKPQFRTKTIVIIVSCFVSLTALFAGIAVHVLKKKKENGRCKDLRVQLQQTV